MVLNWLHKQIKYRLLERKWDRVLQKYGSWNAYFRSVDPDYDPSANELLKIFHGYPYIATVKNFSWVADFFDVHPNTDSVVELCKQICRDKYRVEWNRNILCYEDQYSKNGSSPNDVVYIGFKSQEDYVQFKLRWE
jgi:hypothetical protein